MGFGTPLSNIPSADKADALPQAGFWKPYKNGVVDFFRAWGHVSMELMPEINVQIGHGQQFLGHGHRSLLLSDLAPAYFFVRVNTQFWKLRYTNLYANIAPFALKDSDRFTEKYFAMHHLALDITPNFQIGLFENVLFSRGDSTKQWGFDPGYINPIIFFRAVEHNKASLDNVMLGMDFKWNIAKRWQFYGQLALDEFKTSEILNGQGSYINKFAAQAGMKWIDVAGIAHLDLQLEGNLARPFTYTHSNRNIQGTQSEGNYQHFGQPLAHPWGANFIEGIAILRYQPVPKIQLTAKMLYGQLGEDAAGQNMGGNILKPYDTATRLTGNKILQGVKATNTFGDFTVSWQAKHGLFIDLKQIVRKFDSQDDTRDNNTIFTSIAVRWNMAQWSNEF
jgi:hypothetical protein